MPTLDRLAAESGVCRSSIPGITKRLVEALSVILKKRKGNRVCYEIVITAPQHMLERGVYWHPRKRKVRNCFQDPTTGQFKRSQQDLTDLDSSLYAPLDSKQSPKSTEQVVPKTTEHPVPKERFRVVGA